jgi:hypothetical protein
MSVVAFVVVERLWDAAWDSTGITVIAFAFLAFALSTGALALLGWARTRIRLSHVGATYSLGLRGLPTRTFTRSGGLTRGIEGDARRGVRAMNLQSQAVTEDHFIDPIHDRDEAARMRAYTRSLSSHVGQMEILYMTLDESNRFVCRRGGTEIHAVEDFLRSYLYG